MQKRRLGTSDLEISVLGIGTYALGGSGWKFAWGPQDDEQSVATLVHALSSGINWVDTAAVYGHGHAELLVGRAIRRVAERPLIFTKCSMLWDERGELSNVLKRDSIRREVEDSLQRLGIDVIDLYQVHWPRADADIEEAWQTLAELKAEGKVRYIGVSNFDVAQMKRAQRIAPITSLQPPYSLLDRSIEAEILPYAADQNIGVIAYSPLQNGLLSGKMTRQRVAALPDDDWRKKNLNFQEPQLSRQLAVAERLREIAAGLRHGGDRPFTVAELALAWVLHQRGVTGAIVGARTPEQVDDFLRADQILLDAATLEKIGRLTAAG